MKNFIVITVSILFVWAVILLAQVDKIIFSHQFHAEDAGAECADCHEAASNSLTTEDNLLPSMETCYTCHDEDETECTVCHTNPDEAGEYPRYIEYPAKFAHKIHIDDGQECLTCHEGILEKEDAGKDYNGHRSESCRPCDGCLPAKAVDDRPFDRGLTSPFGLDLRVCT